MNAEQSYLKLLEVLRKRKASGEVFELAGLAIGGVWVAERLATDLGLAHYGVINVAFHRDDYAEKGMTAMRTAKTMPTQIPYEVNEARLILLDDVLFTGRTVRAALNELFDFGRPSKVELMVLVDRENRELPISADFVGEKVQVPNHQVLVLEKNTDGTFTFQLEDRD